MVQIVGKYQYASSSPDFQDYLKVLKVPEALIQKVADAKPIITISEEGGVWTQKTSVGAAFESTLTFKLGEPYEQTLPNQIVKKHVTKREGDDKLITESTTADSKDTKTYQFNDDGFTINLFHPASNSKASVVFKRI